MKIYGRVTSSNVMKVLWAADELGLDYDRIDAGMNFGVVDSEEYRSMNPNGRVPTLVDGDLVLWESNVIVRYLAAKHGKGTLWQKNFLLAQTSNDGWTGNKLFKT
jgi:glutathione S-transferase